MSTWGLIACAAALLFLAYEIGRGWQTGRTSFRALNGDRDKSPTIYWFLMALNTIAIVAILVALLRGLVELL